MESFALLNIWSFRRTAAFPQRSSYQILPKELRNLTEQERGSPDAKELQFPRTLFGYRQSDDE